MIQTLMHGGVYHKHAEILTIHFYLALSLGKKVPRSQQFHSREFQVANLLYAE